MEVLIFNGITYKTPSHSAFHCRKIFHSMEKKPSEELEQWFCRIETAIAGCDFGDFTHFMLIDKFICGLSEEIFEKYSKTSVLDVEQLLSIGTSDTFLLNNSFAGTKFEPIKDIDELLSLEIVGSNVLNGDEYDLENDNGAQSNNDIYPEDSQINEEQLAEEIMESDLIENEEDNPKMSDCLTALDKPLQTHIKGFLIDAQNRIVCLDCDKIFALKSSYNIHKRIHTGTNLHRCKVCDKIFTTRSKMLRHMPTHDNDGRNFECYLCSFQFDQFYALRIHFNMKHLMSKEDAIHCTICNPKRKFLSRNAFDRHLKVHQGLTQTHKCPHCDREFEKRGKLSEHIHVHSDFKQFVCESCGKAFKTRKQLKLHSRRHSEKPLKFKCAECGLMLTSSFSYKNHLRQHTGERPFACEICQKTFVQRANLLRHLMVHRNEKPHSCSVCEKRFATMYHLKIHKSVHTGEKPYKCKQCDRAYTQLGTLKAHQAKAHSNSTPGNSELV